MLLQREGEVGAVLLGQRGQRQHHVGHVQALVVRDGAADLDLGRRSGRRSTSRHPEDELAVVDQQPGARLHRLENLAVRQVGAASKSPSASSRSKVKLWPVFNSALSSLNRPTRSLGPCRSARIVVGRSSSLSSAADRRDPPLVIGVAAVAHVDPEGVGAGLGSAVGSSRACRWLGRASPGSAPCGCAARTGWGWSPFGMAMGNSRST